MKYVIAFVVLIRRTRETHNLFKKKKKLLRLVYFTLKYQYIFTFYDGENIHVSTIQRLDSISQKKKNPIETWRKILCIRTQ